jgi:hypothetical protein
MILENIFGVRFQSSGLRNPKRSGKVEKKFQAFNGRTCTMFNGVDLKNEFRNEIK